MSSCISIIIPTYNSSDYIIETINSCLKQTYKDIEIVVVDDCSTDNTREILLRYKDRIKIILNENNLGIVKNVNKGVSHSDSDFILLLGHDDLLPPEHIEIMLAEFDENVVAVHCNSMGINKFGEEGSMEKSDLEQKSKTDNTLFELSLNNFISSCGMVHRTSTFQAVNGWDEKYLHYGEWLYYIEALGYGDIKYTTKSYAYYRRHDSNITNTFKSKDVLKKLNVYKNHCRELAFSENDNSFAEYLKYHLLKFKIFMVRLVKNI